MEECQLLRPNHQPSIRISRAPLFQRRSRCGPATTLRRNPVHRPCALRTARFRAREVDTSCGLLDPPESMPDERMLSRNFRRRSGAASRAYSLHKNGGRIWTNRSKSIFQVAGPRRRHACLLRLGNHLSQKAHVCAEPTHTYTAD